MMMSPLFVLFLLWTFLSSSAEGVNKMGEQQAATRTERAFSLFSIVQFPNEECTTDSSNYPRGSCLASDECTSNGGTAMGNCASGFGVCCVISSSTCGSTVSKNVTYLSNPGYPNTYSTTGTCEYTVSKLSSDICQLRLDFVSLEIAVTTATATAGQCGGTTNIITDALTVAGQSGSNPPVICGTSTGSHMYVDVGAEASDTVSVKFELTATTGAARKWAVKVTQIECGVSWRCDTGCTQCYTGVSGNIKSYGFGSPQLLQSQQYSACVRQELGYCSVAFTQSTDTTTDPFDLGNAASAGVGESTADACALGYVKIPGGFFTASGPISAQLCGECLCPDGTSTAAGPYTTSLKPFRVDVVTAAIAQVGDSNSLSTGFSLDFNQRGC